jgi:predicted transcriptional regulator
MTDLLPDLGDLEREVMQLVWAHGPVTADDVRQRLPKTLKDSTVRTVLKRLEQKGYVRHRMEGRTFHYEATEERRSIAAKAVQKIVDWFCNGSVDEVLVGMLDSKMLDQKQLKELSEKIAKAKVGKK